MAEEAATIETPTEAPEPTEIRGTFLVPENMEEEYTGPRLIEPGMMNEQGEEVRPATEEAKPEEEKPVDETKEEVVVPETPITEPEPIGVEDPGDFKPTDRSFDVTVYDAEGKAGQTKTIRSVDDWNQLLESDPNLGSAAALLKAQNAATKMDLQLDRERSDWEKQKTQYDEATQLETQRTESLNEMANEIKYLETKGELPAIDAKYENADWADSEVAKQPGVKERIDLLNYMRDENTARTRAGLKPMTSVLDAHNAYQLDQSKTAAQTARTKAAEARKAAGARVAGTTSAPVNVAPKGIMVGRTGVLD